MSGVRYNPRIVKRFIRTLLNAATVLSLIACAGTVLFWVRSSVRPIVFFVAHWEGQVFGGQIRFLYDGTVQEGENSIPLWLVVLLTGVVPGIWCWRRGAANRQDGNFCGDCGYDLRATPERCPECGAVPAEVKS